MTTHIALLRAINVAGHQNVAMAELRAMFEALGFDDVRTLLQTGNVVFRGAGSSAALERKLESEAKARLGLETDFMVRTVKELAEAVAENPFPREAERDPGHLVLLFLKDAPKAADVKALQAAIKGRETVETFGKQLYAVYPDGIGRSNLTNKLIEDKLTTRATGRNWNTVLKLAALADEVRG
jgi:uncharacterized protein (DUF1697 family)